MRRDDVIKKSAAKKPPQKNAVPLRKCTLGSYGDEPTLTRLIGGYIDGGVARRDGALGRDAVDGLDLEAVVRVSLQVPDGRVSLGEAQAPRRDLHIVVTAHAGAVLALLAHHVVHKVGSAARVAWLRPLQRHRRLVYAGDHAERG